MLSLGITKVYIDSFGSPKFGDRLWQKVCDATIQVHRRVAIRSDMITTVPRVGYSHAGKRVALPTRAEMF